MRRTLLTAHVAAGLVFATVSPARGQQAGSAAYTGSAAPADRPDAAPVRFVYALSVGGADAGKVPVAISQEEIWVDRSALERVGVRCDAGRPLVLDGIAYVALTSLTRELGYEVDERAEVLRLTSRAARLTVPAGQSGAGGAGRQRPPDGTPEPAPLVGTTDAGRSTVVFRFNQNNIEAPVVWQGPLSTLVVPASSHANLRVESRQHASNFGWVEGSVDLANGSGTLTPTSGFVGVSEVRAGAWTLNLRAGDRPLDPRVMNLEATAMLQPPVGLRGAAFDFGTGWAQGAAFAGRTTVHGGYFGESVLTSAQFVSGLRLVAQPDSRLGIGVGALHTSGRDMRDPIALAGSDAATASARYDATAQIRVAAETSIARYTPAPDAGNRQKAQFDGSYAVAGRITGQQGQGELDLLRLGPAYMPLSFTRVGDRAGLLGSGDYRFGDRLQIDGTAQHWSTNVGQWSPLPRFDLDNALAGFRYAVSGRTSISGRLGLSRIDETPRALSGSTESRTVNADWSQVRGAWRASGRLTDISTRQQGDVEQESARHRLDVDLRRAWPRGSSVWTTVGLIRERIDRTAQSIVAGGAGGSWTARPSLSLYSEATWNQELAGLAAFKVDTFAAGAGVDWTIVPGLRLSANGRAVRNVGAFSPGDIRLQTAGGQDAVEQYLLDRQRGRYQFTVNLQKDLSWGSRLVSRQAGSAATTVPLDVGRIEGSVFNDLHVDGVQDESDPAVPDVAVRLDSAVVAKVDARGRFSFTSVPVGRHTLALDPATVPANYDMSPPVGVEVLKRGVVQVDFPLVLLGRIRGRAVVQEPDDALRLAAAAPAPARERPGAGILVELDNGARTTITDDDGQFEFSGVVRGHHSIGVVTASLPAAWRTEAQPPVNVSIEPGERVDGLRLIIFARSAGIRRVTVKPQGEAARGHAPHGREQRLLTPMKNVETRLSDDQRAMVTTLLVELTARKEPTRPGESGILIAPTCRSCRGGAARKPHGSG